MSLGGPGLSLAYTRFYNSQHEKQGALGYGWTGSFSEQLELSGGKIILHQADAAAIHFHDDGQGEYVSEADMVRIITPHSNGHLLTEPDGRKLSFDE